jgi:hypothetical protein
MRHLSVVLSMVALLGGIGCVAGQELERKALRMPVRITATIPRLLDLQVAQPTAGAAGNEVRVVSLFVRANCPWVLRAETIDGGAFAGTLQQFGANTPPAKLTAGTPATIACRVPHFAGEHTLQFALSPADDASSSSSLRLRLWVESTEGKPLASPSVTMRVGGPE